MRVQIYYRLIAVIRRWKASLRPATVVLVVVTPFRKLPKADIAVGTY